MQLALQIALAQQRRPTIILVSDLDDNPDDLPALSGVLAEDRRDRVPVRVVGLNPASDDVAYFIAALGPNAQDHLRADARPGGAAADDAVPVGSRRARADRRNHARPARGLGAEARLEGVMNAPRVAAAAVLATLAVLVALLAADVRAWPAAIERGDALYALDPASAQWSASTRLGGLAGSIVGTAGDLAARRGLAALRPDDRHSAGAPVPGGDRDGPGLCDERAREVRSIE